jgi:hypothetical protein
MKFSRIILLAVVLICLFSVFSGPLMRPVYDRLMPSLIQRFGGETRPEVQRPITSGGDDTVHLMVLNGIGVSNLAGDISLLLDKVGCVGQGIGNAPHDHYPESLLVNRRLPAPQAEALARRLGDIRLIHEVDVAADEDAVLVLGADYDRIQERLEGTRGPVGR